MIIPEDHALLVTEYLNGTMSEVHSFTIGCLMAGSPPGTPTEAADRMFDIWESHSNLFANETTILSVTCYATIGGVLNIGVSTQAAFTGTLGTGAAPPSVSWLVRKNTGLAGRKFRGRAFMPQPRDADVNAGGFIESAAASSINALLADVLVDMDDNGLGSWSIPARLLHTDATAPTEIISLVLDPKVGTQVRRGR